MERDFIEKKKRFEITKRKMMDIQYKSLEGEDDERNGQATHTDTIHA